MNKNKSVFLKLLKNDWSESLAVQTSYFTHYSCVPIKRAGPIKQAGRNFQENFRNEQALLNKQGGIFKETLEMSRLY